MRAILTFVTCASIATYIACRSNVREETTGASKALRQQDATIRWPSAVSDAERRFLMDTYGAAFETVMGAWSSERDSAYLAVAVRVERPQSSLRFDIWKRPISPRSVPSARSTPGTGNAEVDVAFFDHMTNDRFPDLLALLRTEDGIGYPVFFAGGIGERSELLKSRFDSLLAPLAASDSLAVLRAGTRVCAFSVPAAKGVSADSEGRIWFGWSGRSLGAAVRPNAWCAVVG
jgi:hypothetical protein